jgi:hypothetical protein
MRDSNDTSGGVRMAPALALGQYYSLCIKFGICSQEAQSFKDQYPEKVFVDGIRAMEKLSMQIHPDGLGR